MDEVALTLREWNAAGRPYAVATITAVRGSAPHGVGTVLAVDTAGALVGSVSGGCVDGEVYELCRQVIHTGEPITRTFQADPDDPFAPALPCGGSIEVAIRYVDPLAEAAPADVAGLERGASETPAPEPVAAPQLLVIGAVAFAGALIRLGKFLDYRVTLCDARPVFATRERFPEADEIVVDWPDRFLAAAGVDAATAICVLTHDPKFDVPALVAALRSPASYVGAIGSRRTCADRAERLRAAGVTEDELARLRSPVGLDLGSGTPQEVALSIGAEIVALRNGRGGRPLRETAGPLHGAENRLPNQPPNRLPNPLPTEVACP